MFLAILTWIVIFNTSIITLSDAMLVVDNEAVEVGDIKCGESRRIEVEQADSVRVVFRLGEDWIGTDLLPMRDTIEISDSTKPFEVEILEESR